MPAETHRRSSAVATIDVVALFGAVLGLDGGVTEHRSLVELGCDDDLTLLDLWEAGIEEYGERTVADVDVEELRAARTLAGLARLVVATCRATAAEEDGEA